MLGSSVLFLLMMLAENRKACSSAFMIWALGPSAYSKIPPARDGYNVCAGEGGGLPRKTLGSDGIMGKILPPNVQ